MIIAATKDKWEFPFYITDTMKEMTYKLKPKQKNWKQTSSCLYRAIRSKGKASAYGYKIFKV